MREEISCILRIWRRLITLPRRTPDVWHADEARARARGDGGGAAAAPGPRAPRDVRAAGGGRLSRKRKDEKYGLWDAARRRARPGRAGW